MKTFRSKDSGMAGFSLLELIVVIAIITLLAGILTPLVKSSLDDAKVAKIVSQVDSIKKAALKYYYDCNALAVEEETTPKHCLFADSNSIGSQWKGPYLEIPLGKANNPYDKTKKFELQDTLTGNATADGYVISGSAVAQTVKGGQLFIEGVPDADAQAMDVAIDGVAGVNAGMCELGAVASGVRDVYIYLFKK